MCARVQQRLAPRGHPPVHLSLGIDCVEVTPACDHAELTRMAAANFFVTTVAGRVAARDG
jgi:arginase family enzyme